MQVRRRTVRPGALWSILRPLAPLTPAHLLIRLNDPSTEFNETSATDWLLNFQLTMRALTQAFGTTGCELYFAYQWLPVDDCLGEPAPEISTPTMHVFGRLDQLRYPNYSLKSILLTPAHQRSAVPAAELEAADLKLRQAFSEISQHELGPLEPTTPRDFPASTGNARSRGLTLQAQPTASSLGELNPQDLLKLGAQLGRQHAAIRAGGGAGLSCWTTDAAVALDGSPALQIRVFGRSRKETVQPLAQWLDSWAM